MRVAASVNRRILWSSLLTKLVFTIIAAIHCDSVCPGLQFVALRRVFENVVVLCTDIQFVRFPEQGKWLQAVVRGHTRYYGVPMNTPALRLFRFQVGRLWHRTLSKRSQNGRVLWDRMRRLIARWLPLPSVCHP